MRTVAIAMLLAAGASGAGAAAATGGLVGKPAFTPLPVGKVVPEGWLLEQLKLQAEGGSTFPRSLLWVCAYRRLPKQGSPGTWQCSGRISSTQFG